MTAATAERAAVDRMGAHLDKTAAALFELARMVAAVRTEVTSRDPRSRVPYTSVAARVIGAVLTRVGSLAFDSLIGAAADADALRQPPP